MNDDWQDAAFSNRHTHNRVGKQGRGKGGRSNGAFDVQRIFGSYEIKCPAANKILSQQSRANSGSKANTARLEMYTLNELGNALIGELLIPDVLHGTVLLAGSRKVMKIVIQELERQSEETSEDAESNNTEADANTSDHSGHGDATEQRASTNAEDENEDEDDGDEEEDEDSPELQDQRPTFEKNSFRSPKFWLKWQGQVFDQSSSEGAHVASIVTDSGYIVFAGNKCDKLDGTLSCDVLGWSNVKISGWKIASKPARDFALSWQDSGS
jgi:hypothetical protein